MTQTEQSPVSSSVGKWKAYPAYKDSGVEWLGEIPEHWEVTRLKRIFTVFNGATPSSSEPSFWDGDIPWVTPEDLGSLPGKVISSTTRMITERGYKSCGTNLVPASSLILSTRAPIGHIAIAGVPLCTNQGCRSLVFQNVSIQTFFFYFLQVMKHELQSWGQGSTFLELGKSKLESVNVLFPPISEQPAIVAFLDRETNKLNELIAKKEQMIKLLQEKRAALISHAVTKGLDAGVKMRDSGVEWLGEIPEHWEVRRLKFLTKTMIAGPFGSSLTKDLYTTDGFRVYGQEQVIPADFSIGDYYISEEMYMRMKRYAVSSGDVLVSCVGTFGKVAVVPPEAEPGIINPRLAKLIPNKDEIISDYLGILLKSRIAFEQMDQVSRGGTMGVINLGLLSDVLLPLPSLYEQTTIISYLNLETAKIDALISRIREGIEKLKEYSTALISAAVTGKIDVRGEVASMEDTDLQIKG